MNEIEQAIKAVCGRLKRQGHLVKRTANSPACYTQENAFVILHGSSDFWMPASIPFDPFALLLHASSVITRDPIRDSPLRYSLSNMEISRLEGGDPADLVYNDVPIGVAVYDPGGQLRIELSGNSGLFEDGTNDLFAACIIGQALEARGGKFHTIQVRWSNLYAFENQIKEFEESGKRNLPECGLRIFSENGSLKQDLDELNMLSQDMPAMGWKSAAVRHVWAPVRASFQKLMEQDNPNRYEEAISALSSFPRGGVYQNLVAHIEAQRKNG